MYGIKTPTSYMSPELSLHKWKFQVYLCGEKKKTHKNKKTFLDGILFYFTLTSVFYFVIFYGITGKGKQ